MKKVIFLLTKRKNIIWFLRFVILCLLIFPSISLATSPTQQVVICFDFSRSVRWLHAQKKLDLHRVYSHELQKITQALSPQDQYAVICFATYSEITKKFTTDNATPLTYTRNIDSSRINIAIQSAISMFDTREIKRKTIIVYSDGLSEGLTPPVKDLLTQNNIELRFEYLQTQQIKQLHDVAIDKATLPLFAKQGQTLHCEVIVKTSHNTHAVLQILNYSTTIEQRRIYLPQKGKYTFHFFCNVNSARDMSISAHISPLSFSDQCPQNNVYFQHVYVKRKSKILEFGTQLQQINISFANVTSLAQPTTQKINVEDYDVFVISNMPFAELQRFDSLINQYTASGRGLMMIASPNTFAMGGYANTLIESALPVWSNPRQKNSRHIIVLLDISGSMNEKYATTTKIEAAKQAILEIERQLNGDTLQLIAFNNNIYDIFSAKTQDINTKIAALKANGETKMLPALHYALNRKPLQKKHIVVISDGEVQKSIVSELGALPEKTSVSVISTGTNNNVLQKIAHWGKGSFYDANSTGLREIIWRDLLQTKGTLLIDKPAMITRKSQAMDNWNWQDYLQKYVDKYMLTKAKPSSQTLLQTVSGDPILCIGNYQLGKCAALMTNTSWTNNLAVEKLITQTLQWLSSTSYSPYQVFVDHHHNKIRIRYHVEQHNQKIIVRPQWLSKKIPMREQNYGIYTAEVTIPENSSSYAFALQHQNLYLPVHFRLAYSPEYTNLTEINYSATTKNSNKNSNKTKNMDNILICLAITCFLLERFLTRGI